MLAMLLAYDAVGNVIATLDYMVARGPDGEPAGLIDFETHELAGGAMTDVWTVESVGASLAGQPGAFLCPGVGTVHPGPNGERVCPGGEWRRLAAGSKTWPEWIGGRAHDFRVELTGPSGRKRITALVHRTSGHRRERSTVEAAIAARMSAASGVPADIRDLVGGPDRPLSLDDDGRTLGRQVVGASPPGLPVVRVRREAAVDVAANRR